MDFDRLGESLVSDWLEDNDNYTRASSIDEFQRTGKFDFEKAKAFLTTVNPRLNISLYDHLADVVNTVLRSKVPDAVEKLEELSLEVKKMRQMPDSDLTEVFELSDELQAFIEEKEMFYKIKMPVPEEVTKTKDDDDEDEADSEDEEEENGEEVPAEASTESVVKEELDLSGVLPDLHYVVGRFNEAGIGLSAMEVFEMTVALKDLAIQFKLKKVRFWGKMFGLKNDYYIAEAPYQEGVVYESYGWKDVPIEKEQVTEDELEEKEEQGDDEEDQEEKDEEEEDEEQESKEGEETEESKKPEIPPIPTPKQKEKKTVPPEANGTGVNEYLYFVCSKIGHPWRVLPFILPSQISEARYLKRFLTGNLETEIRGCVPYPGKEAHYLRAQIARITGTTYIAPQGYYKRAGEKDDEDEDDEEEEDEDEEKDKNQILLNPNFIPKSSKYLISEGLEGWFHYRKAVLEQGRCIPMKLEKDEDNGEEDKEEEKEEEKDDDEDEDGEKAEVEDPEILEAIVEMEVPILRSLSEDRALGRLKPWSMRLSSRLIEERAVLIVYSNTWPGAYTFYDGKSFEHIYIGYGYKYSVFHYAPPIRVSWQSEYVVGKDLIEHVDEEILPTIMDDPEILEKLEAGFQKLQAATDCKSLLKKYLTREVFDACKNKKTALGATLLDCIQSGVENLDSGVGIYAPDAESYTLFAPIFNPVIEDYHKGFKPTDQHPPTDFGDIDTLVNVDPEEKYVVSTRVRCGRSLQGYAFNPCLTEANYEEMEENVSAIFDTFEGELKGQYHPLTGMDKDTQQQLIDDHFLFKEGDRFLQAANACRYWPTGRGIYHNDDKTFLVWCNEEDHLRIISMQKGGDLKAVFQRLVNAVNHIEEQLPFSRDERLGYLTFCPTNLGTTIRASVHIALPKLAKDLEQLEAIAAKFNLQVRGTRGEHTESEGGVYDISNKRRMGLTEYEAVKEMQDGILEMIKMEAAAP